MERRIYAADTLSASSLPPQAEAGALGPGHLQVASPEGWVNPLWCASLFLKVGGRTLAVMSKLCKGTAVLCLWIIAYARAGVDSSSESKGETRNLAGIQTGAGDTNRD